MDQNIILVLIVILSIGWVLYNIKFKKNIVVVGDDIKNDLGEKVNILVGNRDSKNVSINLILGDNIKVDYTSLAADMIIHYEDLLSGNYVVPDYIKEGRPRNIIEETNNTKKEIKKVDVDDRSNEEIDTKIYQNIRK